MVVNNNVLRSAIDDIKNIRVSVNKGNRKPHKYIFLLTIAHFFENDSNRPNVFAFTRDFEEKFRETCLLYFSESDCETLLLEYPFSHLKSDGVWLHAVKPGFELKYDEYSNTQDSGKRLTASRIKETIEYGYLREDIEKCFRDNNYRKEIVSVLESNLLPKKYNYPQISRQNVFEPKSLFEHESNAIQNIESCLNLGNGLGYSISNLQLHDPQSNRYFETDIIVVCLFGVYIVELKHWSGLIEIQPNSWIQNQSFFKPDPHKANSFKAKLLKGIIQKRFPHLPGVYFESVVVLTNPESDIRGANLPHTQKNNPSFYGIDNFIKYLKAQHKSNELILSQEQAKGIVDYLRTLRAVGRPRDFQFPGYEIVERLYQGADRSELVARRVDVKYQRLSRLRIFYPAAGGNIQERNALNERARATLNRMAVIGDHPNILKVWSVPNENGFIVEGSDWSQTGTLRDLIDSEKSIDECRAKSIAEGILHGLDAIHQECIIHRALAPENILMINEVPKLMNFDLSYQLEEEKEHQTVLIDAAKLKRNPYTAPEIYQNITIPEATADIFGLGVILFEMLTGVKPFKCSTDLETTDGKITSEKLALLEQKGVSTELVQLIDGMIRLEPANRPATVKKALELIGTKTAKSSFFQVDAPLASGDESGLYIIDELCCKGATSQVYKARGEMGRLIALKLFNSEIPQKRIVDERCFATAVRHSAIARVENHGRWADQRFFIAYDWITGNSLREAVQAGHHPEIDQFRNTALVLLKALKALHGYSDENESVPIVHNDIKPDNILLDEGHRPVFIDFGSASFPGVGLYEGTEGYVAPDLRLGEDRQYCPDGDIYGLGVTLCEWLTGNRIISDDLPINVPTPISAWLKKATAPRAKDRFSSAKEMLDALECCFSPETSAKDVLLTELSITDERIENCKKESVSDHTFNPFVAYLNSMLNLDAGGENATAEAQARENLFGCIHVPHPMASAIEEYIMGEDQCHVILTGHAGDGKTTIGLELYCKLRCLPIDRPLGKSLGKREDINNTSGLSIVIIKDFSEWSSKERQDILSEMLDSNKKRFLLISNTGTLLDAFRKREIACGRYPLIMENKLLRALGSAVQEELDIGVRVRVINLAMQDNLEIADKIFTNLVKENHWSDCTTNPCQESCQIHRNLQMIRHNLMLIRNRLFLAYRRMSEYGIRLTLRQLAAHLAYMLTRGDSCQTMQEIIHHEATEVSSKHLFFNLFFGDDGKVPDPRTDQLQAVRCIREQDFGLCCSPVWERRLWMSVQDYDFVFDTAETSEIFKILREKGRRDASARNQVRRLLYFLNHLPQVGGNRFVISFLNSPKIMDFDSWQKPKGLTAAKKTLNFLREAILHVLQEHFTGIRLPERTPQGHYLYITLNRKSAEIRQGAQIVLARFLAKDFQLQMEEHSDGIGRVRYIPAICWKGGKLKLLLDLPFLDYVVMRNQGEISSSLRGHYLNRMEDFKGKLLLQDNDIEDGAFLLSLRNDYSLHGQRFIVENNKLEVRNA